MKCLKHFSEMLGLILRLYISQDLRAFLVLDSIPSCHAPCLLISTFKYEERRETDFSSSVPLFQRFALICIKLCHNSNLAGRTSLIRSRVAAIKPTIAFSLF